MAEAPRSNRPAPRTAAAVEAELRRRVRSELTQARSESETGELDDAALADIIARAVASLLSWHLEAPEHTRNATLSSRSWRPAGGPRAGGRSQDFEDREPRGPRPRDSQDRGPRDFQDRGPRDFQDRGPRDFQDRGPRDFDERGPRQLDDRGPRQFDRGPRGGTGRPPPRGGGGFKAGGFKSGGFKRGGGGGGGPRRPPRPR